MDDKITILTISMLKFFAFISALAGFLSFISIFLGGGKNEPMQRLAIAAVGGVSFAILQGIALIISNLVQIRKNTLGDN